VNSNRARIVIAVVASLAVSAAFYFFFVRSRQNELSEVRSDVEAAKSETMSLQAELTRLKGLQENAPKLEARLNEFRQAVPQDDQVANLIFQVQDAANKAGINFVQVDPDVASPPLEGAQVAQVKVVIGAKGGYFSLQDFVRRLYDLDRALRFDTLDMVVNEEDSESASPTDLITMTGMARIFFEMPEGGVQAAPGTTTAPTAPAAPAPATQTSPAEAPAP
jgi:Tfp pilus assembly protein PilO